MKEVRRSSSKREFQRTLDEMGRVLVDQFKVPAASAARPPHSSSQQPLITPIPRRTRGPLAAKKHDRRDSLMSLLPPRPPMRVVAATAISRKATSRQQTTSNDAAGDEGSNGHLLAKKPRQSEHRKGGGTTTTTTTITSTTTTSTTANSHQAMMKKNFQHILSRVRRGDFSSVDDEQEHPKKKKKSRTAFSGGAADRLQENNSHFSFLGNQRGERIAPESGKPKTTAAFFQGASHTNPKIHRQAISSATTEASILKKRKHIITPATSVTHYSSAASARADVSSLSRHLSSTPKIQQAFASSISCDICMGLQVQSTVLVPCGHSFCKSCCGATMAICPTCQESVQLLVPNRALDQTTLAAQTAGLPAAFFGVGYLQVYQERSAAAAARGPTTKAAPAAVAAAATATASSQADAAALNTAVLAQSPGSQRAARRNNNRLLSRTSQTGSRGLPVPATHEVICIDCD